MTCCVCFKNDAQPMSVLEKGSGNRSLHEELSLCVPDVEWLQDYYLCAACIVLLEQAYSFREACLYSDTIRKQLNAQSDTKIETEIISNETSDEECKESSKKNVFICFDCNDTFSEKIALKRHIKRHLQAKEKQSVIGKTRSNRITVFTCELCPATYNTSKKLIEHCKDEHKLDDSLIKPFRCSKCSKCFTSSSNLVQHKKYHEGNRTHVCSYCGKGFITSSDLINHEKQHLNRREYKCEFCLKEFNTHKDLRSHKIIKHKDPSTWNYLCTTCNKRFHIKSNYDNHMRRHVGDKRFVCKLCEKCFITKDELRKHKVSHTNIREFRCEHCGKEYKEKRVLDIHLAKIHKIGNAKVPVRTKKHLCNICAKAFYDKNKLTRHLFTHSGERPFSCDICDKKFTDKSYVKQHLRTAHKVLLEESNL